MVYNSLIKNLNKAITEYNKLYPKPDWDENTLKSLILIKGLHREIMTTNIYEVDEEIRPGYFRGSDIGTTRTDGSFKYFVSETELYPKIETLIKNTNKRLLCADFNSEKNYPFIIAVDLHVDFLNIHPFRDGNGRTARILMNMINLKYKIPLFSPRSEENLRLGYYN